MERSGLSGQMIAAVAATNGTPVWIYDAATIEGQIGKLKSFDTIRYAQKANSNLSILKLMRRNGVKVDSVSNGELDRAIAAGYAPEAEKGEIVFTADVMDRATLERVVAQRIAVNCGSPDMVRQLAEKNPGHPVWLRINPGFGHGHSAKTNTGGPSSKHGIWHEYLDEVLSILDAGNLQLEGLHMHIGSGVDYQHLSRVCDAMVALTQRVRRPVPNISAGGGLSTPYRAGEKPLDTEHYFRLWDEARNAIGNMTGTVPRLEIEPGRFLVSHSGVLVGEVRAVKKVADKWYVILDTGFNELARPAIYGAYHEVSFLTPDGTPVEGPAHPIAVAGPLCESGDVFTQGEGGVVDFRPLPLPKVGDLAVFGDAGAYGASMSSNYNSRPLAAEVMVEGGEPRLIRRRQTVAELLALES